ncbi:MAG: hypothetical protein IT260_05495, partial [Saprospiraceae bacterium]|nr:hypothetical protein [Saprospiraceae bacterium]
MVFFAIRRSLVGFLCLLSFTLFAQIATFQKTYGGPGNDFATDLLELADGYLLLGYTFDPETNNQNGLLIRTDKDGTVLWQKSYGGFGNDQLTLAKPANNGGFILWGSTQNLGGTYSDGWLMQVDDNGNTLWQKTIGQQNFNESARGEIFNMPDGYILSGLKSKPGYFQAFVIRVDNNGETLWSEFTPSNNYNSLSVEILNDSIIFLSGSVDSHGSLRTMNANTGAILQSTEYRISDTLGLDEDIWLFDMGQLPNRDLMVCGYYYNDIPGQIRVNSYLQRISPEGVPVWTKLYKVGFQNLSWHVLPLPDGTSIFDMMYYTSFNQGDTRAILVKIDENGNVLWAHQHGGMNYTQILKTIQTADGGLLSLATIDLNGVQQGEILLLKTDAEGNIGGCCTINIDVTVTEKTPFISHEPITQTPFEPTIPRDVPHTATPDLLAENFCANAQPFLQKIILLCPGQGVTLGDSTYFEATTVTRTLPSSTGGCDTLATYTLGLVPQPTLQQTILLCPGESVILGGNIFSQPGTVTLTLPATTGGCDTLATYTLEIAPQPTLQQTIMLCPGESVTLGGNSYSQPGTVTLTLPASTGGCDTIATYTLELAPKQTRQQNNLRCPGES